MENERGAVFMPKGKPNKEYSGDLKKKAVEDMRRNGLSYKETMQKYGITGKMTVQKWERIYLEEGSSGLYVERRGRATGGQKGKGQAFKLNPKAEEDLIAENQLLRMEIDYLKKLNALVQERELRERKRK